MRLGGIFYIESTRDGCEREVKAREVKNIKLYSLRALLFGKLLDEAYRVSGYAEPLSRKSESFLSCRLNAYL